MFPLGRYLQKLIRAVFGRSRARDGAIRVRRKRRVLLWSR
jgi:hypothetical protein